MFYANAIKAGTPTIFGTYCFVSDLRTGAMSGGSPEQALLSAASAQLEQFYELNCGTDLGMTDSKIFDEQSGYEKAHKQVLVGNAEASQTYKAAGLQPKQIVIDNEIIGSTQRTICGIEVMPDSLSFETIREVCIGGPGHFLGSEQTFQLMRKENISPDIGDRRKVKDLNQRGRLSIIEHAETCVKQILTGHLPAQIYLSFDDDVRRHNPVRLPAAQTRAV